MTMRYNGRSMDVRTVAQLVRHMGPRWIGYRTLYALSQKAGWLRWRAPISSWKDLSLEQLVSDPAMRSAERFAEHFQKRSGAFLFSPADRERYQPLLQQYDDVPAWISRRLEELESGRLRYFSGPAIECGWPPRWNVNAMHANTNPPPQARHFSRMHEFDYGDVKAIWEPSRFSFVFDLVRIYWRTGNEHCAELFWQSIEDWAAHNPPNTGINWKCGQESSLRAMALCFGLWGFLDSPHTTPQRLAQLAIMLATTARRVEANITYALSQQNNHGISEAMGLFTIGLLFPQFEQSVHWQRLGRRLLEGQARELIYDDGGFSQYSANYHRVMLHDFLWVIRLAEINHQPFSDALRQRVVRAGRFLLHIQDRITGGVPRFGNDDGALVLPLTNCDYGDYRPVVQATAALERKTLPYGNGPWNEELLWLFGLDPLKDCPVEQPIDADHSAPHGGYELLRRGDCFAFVRCSEFHHRPAHADLLHTDIWWRGHNIALDPGTYSYNATGAWSDIPLAGTDYHNTVTVDGMDQADRASRFLFLPWPRSRRHRVARSPGGQIGLLDVEQDGYLRLYNPVMHRRAVIQLDREHWVVVDRLTARRQHEYRLHWLLLDSDAALEEQAGRLAMTIDEATYRVQLLSTLPSRLSMVRTEPDSPRGWYAPRYFQLAPAISLAAEATGDDVLFVSILGPDKWQASYEHGRVEIEHPEWRAEIAVNVDAAAPPIAYVTFRGTEQEDRLD